MKVTSRAMVSGSRSARGIAGASLPAPGPHAVRFVQHDQLGAVGQGPEGLERDRFRAVLDPPGQVRAGAGEPDPAVHGEEAAVGEVEHAGPEAAFELVGQGVLAVVVAADRGADPAEGRGADVRGDPQQRPGAVRGGAELAFEHVVPGQLHRGAVDRGDLQALPQQADPEVRVRDGGVQLEQALHDLLAEQLPGLGERAAGRDLRARPGPQAGQPERRRQHRVIAGAGEQARDQHADHGHLRGQHPVVLMARGRLPQRAGDHAVGEQLFQQALPVQLRQPLRPEPRPGRDPGGHLRGPVRLSSGGAAGMDAGAMTMANLAGNKAPGGRKGRRQPSSYQELCSISGTTASRHAAAINMPPDRDQPSENQTPDPISPETLGQCPPG